MPRSIIVGDHPVDSVHPICNIRRKLEPHMREEASAAVAIIFRENEGEPELLLVKRAEVPGDPWSGDMAFPGGKRGPQDRDIKDTVTREVKEETGIDLGSDCYLGSMDSVFSMVRPDLAVLPLVFLQESESYIKINEELTSFQWAPFNKLEGSREMAMVKDLNVPVFHVEGEVVWGLTYRIIENLLELAKEG
jgi:8-oxo-dGTP pyrophosphatase MutT (NUDIX family)